MGQSRDVFSCQISTVQCSSCSRYEYAEMIDEMRGKQGQAWSARKELSSTAPLTIADPVDTYRRMSEYVGVGLVQSPSEYFRLSVII